jgi:hypothetical protein
MAALRTAVQGLRGRIHVASRAGSGTLVRIHIALDEIADRRAQHQIIYTGSLRWSSSGVGLWKEAIHGFIISADIWKVVCEGCEFLTASRRKSSSSGTSRKMTSLAAPSRVACSR